MNKQTIANQKNKQQNQLTLEEGNSNKSQKNKKPAQFPKQQSSNIKKLGIANQEDNKRKWNEKSNNFKTGKFTPDEKEVLIKAVCQYVQSKNMGLEGLEKLVQSKADKDTFGAWSSISECLPLRSVQSCHNFCRRAYNPQNYQGHWTSEQEQELVDLVELHGRKWEKIAQIMGRTATNIRDKFKNIGEENAQDRVKDRWTLWELAQLTRRVQKRLKADFFNKELINQLKQNPDLKNKVSDQCNNSNKRYRMRKNKDGTGYIIDSNIMYLSKYIDYDKAKRLEFKDINWTTISNKIITKSKDDCRNKWGQIMNQAIFMQSKFDSEDDEQLIDSIYDQGVESESEIDFKIIQNGKNEQENLHRWNILKKNVTCRLQVQLPETLKQLAKSFSEKKKQKKQLQKDNEKKSKQIQQMADSYPVNELFDLFKKEYQ